MQPYQGPVTPHRATQHSAERRRRGTVFGASLALLLALALVGCGGGGGGGSDSPAAPRAVTTASVTAQLDPALESSTTLQIAQHLSLIDQQPAGTPLRVFDDPMSSC